MKKLTIILAAVVMGFVMASCGQSTKDAIINDVDKYFADAEQELETIDNADDFLLFAEAMNDRSDILELLDTKYGEKTISDEDNDAIQKFIYDRATSYNQAEALKCAEFLTPFIEQYEDATNELYAQFQANVPFDEESVLEFIDAHFAVSDFAVCENVLPELQDRISAISELVGKMDDPLAAKIDEMFPDEEEEE